ncbi:hypothetical protein BCV70DRAFT_206618 [Testicularia cyperi]|uniref:RING-type domain-containing protein n=1 Tax=Testicularia cyperi TaxID=1882483 RepID=A0A317XND7_9BASI|nr:hypothetical protein BCV70DRAFT_206618 [Testicularia cyperi]
MSTNGNGVVANTAELPGTTQSTAGATTTAGADGRAPPLAQVPSRGSAAGAGGRGNPASLTEALTLRRNLLSSLWIGIRQLPRGRRFVLLTRIVVSLAQIIAFIPILALPSSHRISPSHEEGRICDPDSLFKYLVVHVVRLALSIPVELYLGLSPHRTRQGNRAGPEARARAEQNRPLGSQYLDHKIGKISDLLGIASLVIFFVGNAIVYSATECSQRPAESRPLFWAAVTSLIVVYLVIIEVAILAFLIVCALPLLIVILRALGLQHRLPQREIRPETGKIDQQLVDKTIPLVYYTPALEDDTGENAHEGQADGAPAAASVGDQNQAQSTVVDGGAASAATPTRPALGSRQATQTTVLVAEPPAHSSFTRLARLLYARGRRRRLRRQPDEAADEIKSPTEAGSQEGANNTTATSAPKTIRGGRFTASRGDKNAKRNANRFKYPLHPLPAHRATCPICLSDFVEPTISTSGSGPGSGTRRSTNEVAGQQDGEGEPEPLRLLPCSHVLHKSCVDQWLTTVSGRCPVCQRPVLPTESSQDDDVEQARAQPQPPVALDETRNPATPTSTSTSGVAVAPADGTSANGSGSRNGNGTGSQHRVVAFGSLSWVDVAPSVRRTRCSIVLSCISVSVSEIHAQDRVLVLFCTPASMGWIPNYPPVS